MSDKIAVIPVGTTYHRPVKGWPFDPRVGERHTSACGYVTDVVVWIPDHFAGTWCAKCWMPSP